MLRELHRRAVSAVRSLPRPVRRVFMLRWNRLGYPEISRRLAISQGTARKYFSDARRAVTAAILVSSCLLLALAPAVPLSRIRVSPVSPAPMRPSRVTVSHVASPGTSPRADRVAELSIERAESLLDRLLD